MLTKDFAFYADKSFFKEWKRKYPRVQCIHNAFMNVTMLDPKRFRPLSDVFTSVYKMRHTLETTENTNNSFCSHISIRRKQHKGVKKLFVLQTPVISKNVRFYSAHVKWSSVICHLFILAYIHTFIPIYCNIFEGKQPWWCYNLVLCYQLAHWSLHIYSFLIEI